VQTFRDIFVVKLNFSIFFGIGNLFIIFVCYLFNPVGEGIKRMGIKCGGGVSPRSEMAVVALNFLCNFNCTAFLVCRKLEGDVNGIRPTTQAST
jgi:hypothetical protein